MTRLCTAIFALFLGASVLLAPAPVQAKEWSYSSSSSKFLDFGELGGFSPSGGGTTEIFDIGFNVGGGANLLGCAGISLDGFMDAFANLEYIFDNFLNNIKQAFFRRLLVEAFSRLPQIGALFDTINALGNARFEMFNESCDINSIRADARALLEKRCMEQSGGDFMKCSTATSQDSYLTKVASKVNAQLEKFHQKMSNTNNPLRMGMCEYTSTKPGCALMSFLPQFKLCYSLGMQTGKGNAGRGIGGCTQTRQASAPITPNMLFGGAQGLATGFVGGIANSAVSISRKYPVGQMQAIASSLPLSQGQQVTSLAPSSGGIQLASSEDGLSYSLADRTAEVIHFAGADGDKNIENFRRFMHCSNADPTYAFNKFAEHIGESGSVIDVEKIKKENDVLDFTNTATKLTNTALADAGGAEALIGTAVGCILNHQLHVSLDSYIALTRLPAGDREAFAIAAGSRVAYLATEVILRYLKQKVLEAHAQLASGFTPEDTLQQALTADTGSSIMTERDFKTPEPVLIAIKTIADMFENQIQALRAIRTERDIFASMNSVVHEKIAENQKMADETVNGPKFVRP